MNITIKTREGTFIVPPEKQDQLVAWLSVNAVRVGQQTVGEIREPNFTGRQFITE